MNRWMETRAWEGEGRASRCRERGAVWGKQNRGRSLGEGEEPEEGIRAEGLRPGMEWGPAQGGWEVRRGGSPQGFRAGL